MFSADEIVDYFEGQQPELMRREIDLICTHLDHSVKAEARRGYTANLAGREPNGQAGTNYSR